MKSTVKIIIAEDHQLMCRAYINLLNERKDYEVLGEAHNGKELLELLQQKKPDIILLDLEMPVMSGSVVFEQIKKLYPEIRTIVISTHYTDSYITEYFLKGVNGYVSKNANPEQIFEAIDAVVNEEFYYDKALSRLLLSKIIKDKQQKALLDKTKLTPIELDILKLICEEKTAKKIAEELKLTVYSVENHKRHIQIKTQQNSAIGLFKFALNNGLTEMKAR